MSRSEIGRRDLLKSAGIGAFVGVSAVGTATSHATFREDDYQTTRGDIARIDIGVTTSQNILLTVGDADRSGYEAEVDIDPGGDSIITVAMNTYHAAGVGGGRTFSIESSGSASIVDQRLLTRELDQILAEGTYTLSLEVDGETTSLSGLTLTETSFGEQTIWTAPQGIDLQSQLASGDSSAVLQDLIDQGLLTQANTIAIGDARNRSDEIDESDPLGDWLVHQIEISGAFGLLESNGYDTVAELAADGYFDLPIQIQGGGPIPDSARQNIRVYPDQSAGNIFLVAKTDDLSAVVTNATRPFSRLVGERFDGDFHIDHTFLEFFTRQSLDESDDRTVTEPFDLVDRELTFATTDGEVRARPAQNQTVDGEVTVPPGTTFEVRARSESPGAFLETQDVTVGSDRAFSVTYDFSGSPEGNEFTLRVPGQGFENDAETPGVIGQVEPAFFQISDLSPASATIEQGNTVEIRATVTNTGDQEGTQDVVLTFDGTAVRSQRVTVAAGESVEVAFTGIDTSGLEGAVAHTVASEDEAESGTLEVQSSDPAVFGISDLSPVSTTIEQGDQFEVSATITNTGGSGDTQDVVLTLDGNVLAGQSLTLGVDGSDVVSLGGQLDTEQLPEGQYTYAIETNADTQQGTLTVEPATTQQAVFEVANISPNSPTIEQGDGLGVSATINNAGDQEGTQDVALTLDGNTIDRETLTLDSPGAKTVVLGGQFDTEQLPEGQYTLAIETENDSQEERLTVEAPSEDATFEILAVEPETESAQEGDEVSVDVTVGNAGTTGGTRAVTLDAGGQSQTREVTLDPGEERTVTFDVDTSGASGTVDLSAGTEGGSTASAGAIEVEQAEDGSDDTDGGSSNDGGADPDDGGSADPDGGDGGDSGGGDDGFVSDNTLLIGGGAAAVAAGAAALYAVVSRSGEESSGGTPAGASEPETASGDAVADDQPAGGTATDDQPAGGAVSGDEYAPGDQGPAPQQDQHGPAPRQGTETAPPEDGYASAEPQERSVESAPDSEWRPDDRADDSQWQPDEPAQEPTAEEPDIPEPRDVPPESTEQPPGETRDQPPADRTPADEPQGPPPRDQPGDPGQQPPPRDQPGNPGQQPPPRDQPGEPGQQPPPRDQPGDPGQQPPPRDQPGNSGQQPPPRDQPGDPGQQPPPRDQPGDPGQQPPPRDQPGDPGQQPPPRDQPGNPGQQPPPRDQPGNPGQQPPPRDQPGEPGQQPPPRDQPEDSGQQPPPGDQSEAGSGGDENETDE